MLVSFRDVEQLKLTQYVEEIAKVRCTFAWVHFCD
jgi:hypothetical protein